MSVLALSNAAGFTIAGVSILALLLDLAFLVLVIWALVVVVKLPALLERQASLQQQTQQVLRELLIEIRSVTKAP